MNIVRRVAIKLPIRNISIPHNVDLQSKMRQELRESRQIVNQISENNTSPSDQLRKIEINLYMDDNGTSLKDLSDKDFQKIFFDDDGILKTTRPR